MVWTILCENEVNVRQQLKNIANLSIFLSYDPSMHINGEETEELFIAERNRDSELNIQLDNW